MWKYILKNFLIGSCEYHILDSRPCSFLENGEEFFVCSDRKVFNSFNEARCHQMDLTISFFEKHGLIPAEILYKYTGRFR